MATRAPSLSSADIVRKSITGRRFQWKDYLFQGALLTTLLISLLTLVVLLASLVQKGSGVLMDRGPDFVTSNLSTFSAETAGVWQGIIGSIGTLVFVVIVAIPIGIGAAIYLEEYAPDTRFNRFINVNIRNLAGVPSIVYGLLGLAVFVEMFSGFTGGRSMIAGGLTLAVLVLPIVIITSAEALRAVPDSIREAGYGVGATRWEVIRYHVLPAAAPGIFTGTILSIARALGETAPVLLVGAVTGFLATGGANVIEQMRQQFTTLPTIVFAYSGLPNASFREVAAASILVLLAVILTANAAAILLRNRYERKW